MDELKLIKAIRNKEVASYRILIDTYIKDVQAIVIALCNGYLYKEEMEEVCYKIFENIWNSKEKLILNGKLKSYIFKVAREEVLTKHRHKNQHIEIETLEKKDITNQDYDTKLIDDDLEEYLEKLESKDKEILIRKEFYYQSVEEISKTLKCHKEEISKSLFRSQKIFMNFFKSKGRSEDVKLEKLINNISIKNLDDIEFYIKYVELNEEKIRVKALEITKEIEEELKKKENHRRLKSFYERNINIENIKNEEKRFRIKNNYKRTLIFIIILLINIVNFGYDRKEISKNIYPRNVNEAMDYKNMYNYSKQGVTLSVEKVDLEDEEESIRFNLTKEDGGAFDESTKLKEVKTNSKNKNYEVKSELVEENKKIVCSVKLDKEEVIREDEINITAYNLIKEIKDEKEIDVDLYSIYLNGYLDKSKRSDLGIDIDKVKFRKGELCIQVNNKSNLTLSEKYIGIDYLINNKTGDKVTLKEKVEIISEKGLIENVQYIFDIGSSEELKYLKPVAKYIKEETILNEEWIVNIKLNKSKDMIETHENKGFENLDNLIMKVKVEEVNIGLQRIRIKGSYFENMYLGKLIEVYNEPFYLVYKNGEKVNLNRYNEEYSKHGKFICEFKSEEIIDAKNIETVIIGEMNININY